MDLEPFNDINANGLGIPEKILRTGTIMVYAIAFILISYMILREPIIVGKAVTTAQNNVPIN
ncbi:MAG: hypothetical protein Ct9H300mP9_1690 [Candidatus Neomarinimicrobiota bacterium]|nr:MAG: hypothetical protein Ct9H300mP9_1690 [Candidatus Neomarinimicrobiota bacterium]